MQDPHITESEITEQQKDEIHLFTAYQALAGHHKFKYCIEEDRFYVYREGYWQVIFEMEIMDLVNEEVRVNHLPLRRRKEVIENMKYICKMRLHKFNSFALLNLKNYMIDPVDNNILAHKEEYFSTNRIPYQYDAAASCPLWLKTLDEILENDKLKIELLQEWFGYCICPSMDQKKALLLVGDSNSGKSTMLAVLRLMVGEKNCSSVPLKHLSNPQYTPMMINKLVNIDADVDKNASNYEAEFKIITSGEPISCNQKYVETFEFVPTVKIQLAANIFPKITDHSSAFYKRLIYIPCNRIFEESEQNRKLIQQLKQELPGILNWAIQGLRRLNKRGMFQRHEFMTEAIQELENENNPINLFFDEHIIADAKADIYIRKDELFEKYRQWCDKTKNYCLSTNRFSKCVYKAFHKFTPKDARLSDADRPRIWRHIQYVSFKSEPLPLEEMWQDGDTSAVSNISDAKAASPSVTEESISTSEEKWG